MSEHLRDFILPVEPAESAETALAKERQGQALAEMISQLRSDATTKEDYEEIVRLTHELRRVFVQETEASIDLAVELLGSDNVLGPEAVKKAFGIELRGEAPPIPFSKAELERAAELGQMLVLRVPMADGTPLTMEKMEQILADQFEKDEKGSVFYDTDWYKEEEFFTEETPGFGWALVSREIIPNSDSKNYHEQTARLAEHVKLSIFDDALPPEWREAIDEFYEQKDKLEKLVAEDWQEAAKQLSALKLNKMARHTPVEAIYDLMLRFQNDGQRLLENMYTWTNRLSSDGELVDVGRFDSTGAGVSSDRPGLSVGHLGVSLSRSR